MCEVERGLIQRNGPDDALDAKRCVQGRDDLVGALGPGGPEGGTLLGLPHDHANRRGDMRGTLRPVLPQASVVCLHPPDAVIDGLPGHVRAAGSHAEDESLHKVLPRSGALREPGARARSTITSVLRPQISDAVGGVWYRPRRWINASAAPTVTDSTTPSTSSPQPTCPRLPLCEAYADPTCGAGQHRAPLAVAPVAQGERATGRRDGAGEGVGEEPVLGAEDVDGPCCRIPPPRSPSRGRSGPGPDPVHRRPGASTTPSGRGAAHPRRVAHTVTGAGIRPRTRRSWSRSPSGGTNGWSEWIVTRYTLRAETECSEPYLIQESY